MATKKKEIVKAEVITSDNVSGEKKKFSYNDYAEQITSIRNATETIAEAVKQMPDCTAKKAFGLSVENLEKKLARFGQGREKLSDEEKELLKKFRAGKLEITEKEGE